MSRKVTCAFVCSALLINCVVSAAGAAGRMKCSQPEGKHIFNIIGSPTLDGKLTIEGSGWCSDYEAGGDGPATVAIKINSGSVKHVDTKVNQDKSIWLAVVPPSPKTGRFSVTFDLPKKNSKGFTDYTGDFDLDNFDVTAVAGELSDHAIPGSVTKHYSREDAIGWHDTPVPGPGFHPTKKMLREGLGYVFAEPSKDNKTVAVFAPTLKPGAKVAATYSILTPKKDKCWDVGEPITPDVWNRSTKAAGAAWGNVITYRTVNDENRVILPLTGVPNDYSGSDPVDAAAEDIPMGPGIINLVKVVPGGTPGKDRFIEVGSAWVTNLAWPKTDYGRFSNPVNLRPGLLSDYVNQEFLGWSKKLDEFHFEGSYNGCLFKDPFAAVPTAAMAYPPSVNASREIVIPNSPMVEYRIDDKPVYENVKITDDDAHVVTVVARPLGSYQLIGADKTGTITFKISVPAKSEPVKKTKIVRVVVNGAPTYVTAARSTIYLTPTEDSEPTGYGSSGSSTSSGGDSVGMTATMVTLLALIGGIFGYLAGKAVPAGLLRLPIVK